MNIKLITTCSHQDLIKCERLVKSLKRHSWDYHIILHEWKGFGGKILETYKYLKANPDITHFFYTDAWDTVVCKPMEKTLKNVDHYGCILLSAERACFPHHEKASRYPENPSPWHFVNGGGWFCNSEVFCNAVDTNPLTEEKVDQVWFTDLFLNHPEFVKLDYECDVFQSITFTPEADFVIHEGEVLNTVTGKMPTFIHGNGHTPLTQFQSLWT